MSFDAKDQTRFDKEVSQTRKDNILCRRQRRDVSHACKEHLHLPSDFMFNATYLHSGASIEELNFVCTCLVEVCCRAYLYFGIPPTERMRHLKDFYTVKKSVVKDLKKRRKRGDVKSKDLEQIMERARTVVQHDEDNVDMAVSSSEKRASRGKQLLDEFIRKRTFVFDSSLCKCSDSNTAQTRYVAEASSRYRDESRCYGKGRGGGGENHTHTSSSRLSDVPVM